MVEEASLTEEQVSELKQKLLTLLKELKEAVDLKKDSTKPVELDQPAIGRLSRMDALQHQHMAEATMRQAKLRYQAVQAALRAITAGEYGECRNCGEYISYKRLCVKPEAALCIECQSGREQR